MVSSSSEDVSAVVCNSSGNAKLCGALRSRIARVRSESSPKTFGGYKAEDPTNTILRIDKGFRRLGQNLDHKEWNQEHLCSSSARINGTPLETNGKGISPLLCKASAYAELAERFSAGYLPVPSAMVGSIESPLDPDGGACSARLSDYLNYTYLPGYKQARYEELHGALDPAMLLGASSVETEFSRMSLDDDLCAHWVEAFSISDDRRVSIPLRLVNAISSSNGLAAGNTISEAIVQAACEIFERFCARLVLRRKRPVATIDPKSLTDTGIKAAIGWLDEHGTSVSIKDFTLGNSYPVVGVLFKNRNHADTKNQLKRHYAHLCLSVGSSIDLEQAISRCLTERLQGCLSIQDFSHRPLLDLLWRHWADQMSRACAVPDERFRFFLTQNLSYVDDISFLEHHESFVPIEDLRSAKHSDFQKDVDEILRICSQHGHEIFCVDMTHKILAFPTVRVVIPGVSDVIGYGSASAVRDRRYAQLVSRRKSIEENEDEATRIDRITAFVREAEEYLSLYLWDTMAGTNEKVRSLKSGRNISIIRDVAVALQMAGKTQASAAYCRMMLELLASQHSQHWDLPSGSQAMHKAGWTPMHVDGDNESYVSRFRKLASSFYA